MNMDREHRGLIYKTREPVPPLAPSGIRFRASCARRHMSAERAHVETGSGIGERDYRGYADERWGSRKHPLVRKNVVRRDAVFRRIRWRPSPGGGVRLLGEVFADV